MCPFNDHNFVISALEFKSIKVKNSKSFGRSISVKNMIEIAEKFAEIDFPIINDDPNVEMIWANLKQSFTTILDEIAPKKSFKVKVKDKFPWQDNELHEKKRQRDHAYFKFTRSNNLQEDHDFYKGIRSDYQTLNRNKMIEYFVSKNISDFKNSRQFWEFYTALIRIKSCKSEEIVPSYFVLDSIEYPENEDIEKIFFTSLSSTS